MINRYRRVARTVAELGLGGFVRMDQALTAADDHMDELLVIALGSLVAAIEGRQG